MARVKQSATSSGEARYKRLQSAGSYDLRKDSTSRRWAMYYPIVPRVGQSQIPNVVANVQQLGNAPNWTRNIFSAQVPTGRTFVAERLKLALVPYQIDAGTYVVAPSLAEQQQAKLLLQSMYTKWGRQGAADGFDAEFSGAELLPVFSDFFDKVYTSSTTAATGFQAATMGGDRAGEYRFTVPIPFGQTVQMNHAVDWGADPYVIAPALFASQTANLASKYLFMFYIEGGLTRLGM
jgi:hypothetical protein